MKHIYLTLLLLCSILFAQAQIVNIPDTNFKSALISEGIDANNDGEIQVSEVEMRQNLSVTHDNITDLTGIEAFANLSVLSIGGNPLTTVDLSSNVLLSNLNAGNCQLTELNLTSNTDLVYLTINNNQISNLNINGLTQLTQIEVSYNQLTSLDVSTNTSLTSLRIADNLLTSLDITTNSNLQSVFANNNQISSIFIDGTTSLNSIYINNNLLTSLDFSSVTTSLQQFVANSNQLTSVSLGGLSSLIVLDISENQLTNIDTSVIPSLEYLSLDDNLLTTLDVSSNTVLNELFVNGNLLTNLNLPVSMSRLQAINNQLASIDISGNLNLTQLYLDENQLTNLDVSINTNLNTLSVNNNQLTSLTGLHSGLRKIYCSYNQFSSLDFSGVTNLGNYFADELVFSHNQNLTYINFKNGNNSEYDYGLSLINFNLNSVPNLEIACVDDVTSYFAQDIQDITDQNVIFTEYCSFTPGGEFYTVQGNAKFDIDNNGCTNADSNYSNLALQITNGSEESVFYSDENGNYTMPIQDGNYTITSQLENPNYFSVAPISIAVNFPSDASPFMQDFCITPNGVHNDVEITIVPLEQARPGFDTNYKLLYKNKGNTTLSGNINLSYNDDVMDLVVAMPVSDAQTVGSLTWNYSNILPFETREILFTMSLNTPTDATFPLNGDDILPFTAMINPINADETLDDNTFTLDQVVVNSFDPNDIRCLEGNEIELDQVGKYVHYLIRFENTGTASAVNVVVKDVIDTNTYDLSSLIPLDASHSCVTRVVNDNEVEFIFENIQLPFDDATNDGYVMFKIKTITTLLEGDTFSNQAAIYFDFNAPIITNTAITTVENNLSVGEFDTNKTIKIYPNPVVSELFFKTNQSIEKITVYNLSGKMIKEFKAKTSSLNKINIRSFAKGMYFMKIQTTNGIQTQKIIKE